MLTLLYTILSALIVLASIILGFNLNQPTRSQFEVDRLVGLRRKSVELDSLRYRYGSTILSLKLILSLAFFGLVVIVLGTVLELAWLIIAVLTSLVSIVCLSRLAVVQRLSGSLYTRYELKILRFLDRRPLASRLVDLGVASQSTPAAASKEEIGYIIEHARADLSQRERALIANGLRLDQLLVSELMTPRDEVVFVEGGELLGPVVINDLHSQGQLVFPVVRGGIDSIIGVLDISSLLVVDSNASSSRADEVMDRVVNFISPEISLAQLLKQFTEQRSRIAVVVDEQRKTLGLIRLEDLTKFIFGLGG